MAQLLTSAAGHGFAAMFRALKKVRPERPIHSADYASPGLPK